jgi:K+-transporting ATPase ATPase C chain
MNDLFCSLRLCALSLCVCSAAYPAVILGFAAVAAPETRQGSLILAGDGTIIGSELLAQGFSRPEYFWPRPSAVDYNASATGGSNLSPANPLIAERAAEIISRLQPAKGELVSADLVLTSGSGMDPHISVKSAEFQASRIADARELSLDQVIKLIDENTYQPAFGGFGVEPLVNVLEINLILDRVNQ